MSEIDNGGSAFPHPTSPQIKGMTLRQWFAGQALAGLLACSRTECSVPDIGRMTYAIADAMIAEGNKDGAE